MKDKSKSQDHGADSSVPKGYKKTEVGVIPEDWETKRLGKVATFQRGYDLPHRQRKLGAVPIITSSGYGDTHSESKVTGPGVVTGRYGTIGEVFYVLSDFWPLNTTLYVKDFHNNDPLFVSYLLRTIDFHTHSGKSGVPGVNRNDLHEIVLQIPPTKAEQEAIAGALSDADALIESLEQLIAKKRHIKQGAMQELLTGKKRLPGFQVKPGYKKTEIGVIPEDWLEYTVGDLLDFQGGSQPDKSVFASSWKPGYIRLIQIRDYKTDKYETYAPIHFVRRFCNENDIMIGRYGPPIFQILRGIAGAYNVALIKAIPKLNLNASYAYYFLIQDSLFAFVEKLSQRSSGQTGVDLKELRAYPLPLPPTETEQSAIAGALSDIDAEITALETKLTKTRAIKQGMMHNLLTGKIRLVKPEKSKMGIEA